MKYTLITSNGCVMTFFVLAVAELYQVINGGVLIDSGVLQETESPIAVEVL